MDKRGFLGSFLSKSLKTNQLEVNTDEKTLRPIARLKEPRDLFALPKDKDNDCSQQAPRWPIECQVIEERIRHIPNAPLQPEPFYQQTGNELKPNPVGEENGIVVFNYNPISAVNYDKSKKSKSRNDRDDSSDSDVSSCESQGSSPDVNNKKAKQTITNILNTLEQRSSSNSNDDDDDDDDEDDDTEDEAQHNDGEDGDKTLRNSEKRHKSKRLVGGTAAVITDEEIADIWADKSPEYTAASPTYIKNKIDKTFKAQQLKAIPPVRHNDELMAGFQVVLSRSTTSSSNSSNTDSPTEDGEIDADDNFQYQNDHRFATNNKYSRENLRKSKENPNIIPDMSINLNKLANTEKSSRIQNRENKSREVQSPDDKTPVADSLSFPYDHSYNSGSTQASAPCSSNSSNNNENQANQKSSAANKNNTTSCLPQFSRSAVGGSKFLTNCHPYNPEEYDGLEFESRFESGNLAKALQITPTYYELYLRPDLYTSRSKQWFYFRVKRTKKNMIYRFSIVNLIKSDSLYNEGMRPVMYSNINAKTKNEGWKRCGENICYYRNDDDSQPSEDDEDNSSYTLTFNIEFDNDNDTVFFAHSYPYTYSDLQDYLMEIQKNPIKSKFCKLRLLCRTLAGNNVYYLTVTTPVANEEVMKRKKSIVISARVHPSETPASWMMKGLMDFITGDSSVAKRLRHKFIFKLIPMLNPDGVIVGNTRNSLTGKDLNRQYRTVIRETYPSIWYTKALIKRLIDDSGVSMYCDMHAHSRRHNIFIYGCENKRNPEKKLTEQVFPLMLHKNVADKFSFENCKFKIQRSKEGTGRIVVWMLGITNSYTIEASFGGSLLGSRKGTNFTTTDYEHMGRAYCETLLDYCDENPNKVKRNAKLVKRIKKIRKREKREQKALKLKKLADQECLRLKIIERLLKEGSSAEEPINIPLSDYSSDEGSSSCSENEGKGSVKSFSDLEGPCCHVLRAPPCSPELDVEIRKVSQIINDFRYSRMRKVMQELDRIYFQPLFHKKCRFLMHNKRPPPIKIRKRKILKKSEDSKSSKDTCIETPRGLKVDNIVQSPRDQNKTENSNKITLQYVQNTAAKTSAARSETSLKKTRSKVNSAAQPENDEDEKRLRGGQEKESRPRVKVSRDLRLWLEKRNIMIVRRKTPHKLKFRFKSLHRRKKDDRLLLDMPTTDPGSDLLFSTDDEYIDINGVVTCYGTMPRIRRNLLRSELQRRYIEEIGDGLRNMPPELIITSPSNKAKHRNHSVRILYKPAPERYERKQINSSELPYIGEPAKRTNSWHNLNMSGRQSPKFTNYKPIVTKNNPFNRSNAKKDVLSKEDLDIKLSLKKKIWTGIQLDDTTPGIDRCRPLSWVTSHALKASTSKKISATTGDQMNSGNNLVVPSSSNNIKRLKNDAFLTACTQKLMEWQILNSNPDSPRTQRHVEPIKLAIPDIHEDRTIRIIKHLANIKQTCLPEPSKTDNDNKKISKKNTISKIAETSKIFSKSKSHNNLAASHRSMVKQKGGNQHKTHGRSSKFKTGGIVVTAVQPIGGNTKKNKKTKSQHKLPDNNNVENLGAGSDARRPSTNNGGGGVILAATATTLVRKVKTKLKKKKSPTNTTQKIS